MTGTDTARTHLAVDCEGLHGTGRRRSVAAAWLVVSMAAGVALANRLGQDASGDQLQSHALGAWIALHPHQDLSTVAKLIPALWDVPWLLLAEHASARVVLSYLGALHGIAWWLSGCIAWSMIGFAQRGIRVILTALCVILSVAAPATLTEFGTTFGDLPTSLPILLAVLLLVRGARAGNPTPWTLLAAGALIGTAVGLKLTNGPFLMGASVGVALAASGFRRAASSVGWLAGGSAVGSVVTGGYLWVRYAREFGNPIYPFYNGLFGSPYVVQGSGTGRDTRFASDGAWEQLARPWRMATTSGYPSELPGRDLRWAIIATLLVIVAGMFAARSLPPTKDARHDIRFLAAFMLTSWIAWAGFFGSPRYMIVLEQLSGVVLVLLVHRLARVATRVAAITALAACATTITMIVPAFPSNHQPAASWYALAGGGSLTRESDTMAVFSINDDLNYMVLAFEDDTQFVGLASFGPFAGPGTRTTDDVHRAMDRHPGLIVAVMEQDEVQDSADIAQSYGFQQVSAACDAITSSYFSALVCPWVPD